MFERRRFTAPNLGVVDEVRQDFFHLWKNTLLIDLRYFVTGLLSRIDSMLSQLSEFAVAMQVARYTYFKDDPYQRHPDIWSVAEIKNFGRMHHSQMLVRTMSLLHVLWKHCSELVVVRLYNSRLFRRSRRAFG